MPFNLHIPLPGPVSYNRRLGGRPRRGGGAGWTVFGVLVVIGALWYLRWVVLAVAVIAAVAYVVRRIRARS